MAKGDLTTARKHLDKVLTGTSNDRFVATSVYVLSAQLESFGLRMLERADLACHKGDYAAAVRAYRHVATALGDAPGGKKARQWLASALKNPDLAPALKEARARDALVMLKRAIAAVQIVPSSTGGLRVNDLAKSCNEIVEAISAVPVCRRARILKLCREMAAEFGDTPTGKQVAAAVNQLAVKSKAKPGARNKAKKTRQAPAAKRRPNKADLQRSIRIG